MIKKNTPLVSVVIKVFNAESYFLKSIDSIIKRIYKNWQLIIVNDGSNELKKKII
jgi:glycosyltransferase involved in cell wall biosynthesis